MRPTCSKKLLNALKAEYPAIITNQSYRGLMQYLIFGTFFDMEGEDATNLLVISQKTLAAIESKEDLLAARNYKAVTLLENFKKEVLPSLVWSDWSKTHKEARTVQPINFPLHIQILINCDKSARAKDIVDRVYFMTGDKWSPKKAKAEILSHIELANKTLVNSKSAIAKDLVAYLNTLPDNIFTSKVEENWQEARIATAGNIREENNLYAIKECPKQIYQTSPKGNTARIYGHQAGIAFCAREVRKVITKGWVSFDLAQSQLAIASIKWSAMRTQEFLEAKASIWVELFKWFGFDPISIKTKAGSEIKQAFKTFIYSLMYGMTKQNLKAQIQKDLRGFLSRDQPKAEYIFKHYIIKELLACRDNELKDIEHYKGARDCFGNEIDLLNEKEHGEERTARSILAELAQAVELQLLEPAIRLAIANPDEFKITLWLHDGFWVKFSNVSKQERWTERLKEVTQTQCDLLKVPTRLEVEN